jgi:hypothetical protein
MRLVLVSEATVDQGEDIATFMIRNAYHTINPGSVDPVPEPGTWMLMGTGLVGMLGYGWRRKKQTM